LRQGQILAWRFEQAKNYINGGGATVIAPVGARSQARRFAEEENR